MTLKGREENKRECSIVLLVRYIKLMPWVGQNEDIPRTEGGSSGWNNISSSCTANVRSIVSAEEGCAMTYMRRLSGRIYASMRLLREAEMRRLWGRIWRTWCGRRQQGVVAVVAPVFEASEERKNAITAIATGRRRKKRRLKRLCGCGILLQHGAQEFKEFHKHRCLCRGRALMNMFQGFRLSFFWDCLACRMLSSSLCRYRDRSHSSSASRGRGSRGRLCCLFLSSFSSSPWLFSGWLVEVHQGLVYEKRLLLVRMPGLSWVSVLCRARGLLRGCSFRCRTRGSRASWWHFDSYPLCFGFWDEMEVFCRWKEAWGVSCSGTMPTFALTLIRVFVAVYARTSALPLVAFVWPVVCLSSLFCLRRSGRGSRRSRRGLR